MRWSGNRHFRELHPKRKAKNVIFFIGDGMTTNMVSVATTHKTNWKLTIARSLLPVSSDTRASTANTRPS